MTLKIDIDSVSVCVKVSVIARVKESEPTEREIEYWQRVVRETGKHTTSHNMNLVGLVTLKEAKNYPPQLVQPTFRHKAPIMQQSQDPTTQDKPQIS